MGRSPCCDKSKVKRGTWSPEEDNILKNYMYKHGGTTGGNWATLPQKAGLKRCGKSCRLRWLNYLRPDIKHGAFTQEDENVICSLYNKIGSRWAHIASQLPGRTDNDVKNYWNTNLKKKQPAVITASSSHQKSTIPKSTTVTVSPSRTTADNFRASTNYSLTPPLLAGSLSPPPENNSGYLKAHDRILGQELVDPRSIIDSSTTSTAKSHLHHDPSIYSGIDELFAFDQNPELGNDDSSYCAFGGIWTQEEAVTEADSNEDLFSILHYLSSGI